MAETEYVGPPLAGSWVASPALNPFVVATGAAPSTDDEIVIDRRSAERAGYRVGDRVPGRC